MIEAFMFLVNMALDTKDKEWFEHLISEEFFHWAEPIDMPQEFVSKMHRLNQLYSIACKKLDYQEIYSILLSMNTLREEFGLPKQSESEIKETIYMLRGEAFLKIVDMRKYSIKNTILLLPNEAIKTWEQGEDICIYVTSERELISIQPYEFLDEEIIIDVKSLFSIENICIRGEREDDYSEPY